MTRSEQTSGWTSWCPEFLLLPITIVPLVFTGTPGPCLAQTNGLMNQRQQPLGWGGSARHTGQLPKLQRVPFRLCRHSQLLPGAMPRRVFCIQELTRDRIRDSDVNHIAM